ncbi:MAG TPA: hypothetical protein VGK15_07080 [Candidatus Limnocylindria bacterium]
MRNLALLVIPAVAIGAVALALQGYVDGRVAAGALAVTLMPAPLVAPELVGRMRGRADLAGALVLGTVLVSLLVVGSRGSVAAGALFTATEAYALPAMIGNALPTVRDALLVPLRIVGWLAVPTIFIAAAVVIPPLFDAPPIGTEPPLGLASAVVALALFLVGVVSSAAVARALDRDVVAAIGGAGLRDPALAIAFVTITAGPDSTGVPLAYAVFCLGLAALTLRGR